MKPETHFLCRKLNRCCSRVLTYLSSFPKICSNVLTNKAISQKAFELSNNTEFSLQIQILLDIRYCRKSKHAFRWSV
jgi:hypothetical protein